MKEKHISTFCRLYKILLSISIIAAGLCLIYGSLCIYYSGPDPYSPQAVSEAFGKISVPIYICLGLIAVSLVLDILLPAFSTKLKPQVSYKNRLELLLNKKDLKAITNQQISAIEKERKIRKHIKALQWGAVALSSAAFLIYALNGGHYDNSDINGSVINAMWVLLPCLGVMLLASITSEILLAKSIQREIKFLTELPNLKHNSEADTTEQNKSSKRTAVIRCIVLLVSIGLLIYGFATGGVADVLTKAVNICTECIGLG